MLTVDQYEYIRIAHRVYGKGIRQISRDTGHSRNTIKKALRGEHGGYKSREHQPYPGFESLSSHHRQKEGRILIKTPGLPSLCSQKLGMLLAVLSIGCRGIGLATPT